MQLTDDGLCRCHLWFTKVSNELLYIYKQSNHPPSITEQIPAMISKRIPNVSCNKKCFDKATPDYSNAHKTADYNNAHKTPDYNNAHKTAVSTKTWNLYHDLLKEENAAEAFYGLIRRLAPT